MKRLAKIFVNLIAVMMVVVSCFALTACEDIEVLNVTVSVYDTEAKEYEEKTIKIDLYRHLAPKTVDAIIEAVNNGYYTDAVIYKFADTYSSQYMIGDLKYVDGAIVQNDIVAPKVKGEFEYNGVKGSNLTSTKGSIGLWRSWFESDDDYKTSSNARNSGRATWYMPSDGEISGFNGYFCVFAQLDLEDEDTLELYNDLSNLFSSSDYYEKHVIYYTEEGDYKYTDDDSYLNNGLKFNAVPNEDFPSNTEEIEGLFEAEGQQYVCYNYRTVTIPVSNKNVQTKKAVGAKIVSVTVGD